jgi:tetratricopeptide (TPR) repeat protein
MKAKAYCLYPTIRLNKKDREKHGYELGKKVFAKIEKKKHNYRLISPYKVDYLWVGFPEFEGKKGSVVIKGGKDIIKKQAMYDDGTKSMKDYNAWYNKVYDMPVLVDNAGKLKQGQEVTIKGNVFLVEKKVPKLLGPNSKYVFAEKGVYIPPGLWLKLGLSEGRELTISEKKPPKKLTAEEERILEWAKTKEQEKLKRMSEKEQEKQKKVEELGAKFKQYFMDEKYVQALECANKMLEIDPKNATAWSRKGAALRAMEFLMYADEAMECFNKALEIDPDDANVWFNAAEVMSSDFPSEEGFKEALRYYTKAIELNTKMIDAWVGKGNVFQRLGEHREAIKCYDEALELNPSEKEAAEAWYEKGKALEKLDEKKEARKCFEKAHELDPSYAMPPSGLFKSILGR